MKVHCCLCGQDGKDGSVFTIKSEAHGKANAGALSTHVAREHKSERGLVAAELAPAKPLDKVKIKVKDSPNAAGSTLDDYGFGAARALLGRENPIESRFLKALVDWLAGDLLPLSLVDSPRFRDMIRAANPSLWVPSRGTLATTDIPQRARDLIQSTQPAARLWRSESQRPLLTVLHCHLI